jgi:hypothetical protein
MASIIYTYATAAVDTSGTGVSISPYGDTVFPGGVSLPALTVTPLTAISFSSGVGVAANVVASYLNFAWTSTQSGGNVNAGLQIVVGQSIRNLSGTVSKIHAMARINNAARYSDVILSAVDGNNSGVNNYTNAGHTIGTGWTLLSSPAVLNTSTWSGILAFSLTVLGTNVSGNVGSTSLDVAWIAYEP